MDLKLYQRRVIDEVEAYLAAVAAERAAKNTKHPSLDAWQSLRLPTRYTEHTNGLGEDAPHFCIKVPTGGGKTPDARCDRRRPPGGPAFPRRRR